MAAISQTTLSNTFSWMKVWLFRLKFHWSLFLRVQLIISQHWFRLMAWRRPGDKPLSEPLTVRLPTHICTTRPQWVKYVTTVLCHLSTVPEQILMLISIFDHSLMLIVKMIIFAHHFHLFNWVWFTKTSLMQNNIRKLWNKILATGVCKIKSNLGKIVHFILK